MTASTSWAEEAGGTPDLVGRLFLAVALTEEVRLDLAAHLDHAPDPLPGRRTSPQGWHLTLRFLGDTGRAALDRLQRELGATAFGSAFTLQLGGFGAFPRAARASVIWLGVREGAAELTSLAASVEEATRRAGFVPERRPFTPHLTLSRTRAPQDVRGALDRLPPFSRPLPVREVVLYRSHLGQGPARYEPLARYPLA